MITNKKMNAVVAMCAALVLMFGVSMVSAQTTWVAPTQSPPAGNTKAPLNVSSSGQTKDGGLVLNNAGGGAGTNAAAYGLIIPFGKISIGSTTPVSTDKLDIVGSVNVTSGCYKVNGVCLTGGATGITCATPGACTANKVPKFSGTGNTVVNSTITDTNGDVATLGNITISNVGVDSKIISNRTGGNQFSLQHDISKFFLYNNTSARTAVSVLNNGDVGIRTSTPEAPLHVAGIPSDPNGLIRVSRVADNAGNAALQLYKGSSNTWTGWAIVNNPGNDLEINYDSQENGSGGVPAIYIESGNTAKNVGIGTSAPKASAALDVSSTVSPYKGFLPPRLSTGQRDSISSPEAGLMIYNTSTNKLNVYTTQWEVITSN